MDACVITGESTREYVNTNKQIHLGPIEVFDNAKRVDNEMSTTPID